jgi:hypothetical protein
MSPEIASTWLKLTGKKRSREFSHRLDPFETVGANAANDSLLIQWRQWFAGSDADRDRRGSGAVTSFAFVSLSEYSQRAARTPLHPERLNGHLPHHIDEDPQFQLTLRVFRKIEIEAGVTWNVGPEQRLESSSSDV